MFRKGALQCALTFEYSILFLAFLASLRFNCLEAARYTLALMNWSSPRGIFAILCLIGFVVIAFGTWWETARVRGLTPADKALAPSHQLKLRLMSAAIWLLIFAANFYAVVWLWPTGAPHSPQLKSSAKLFAAVLMGGFSLLIPAFLLLFIDLMNTSRTRREAVVLRQQNMAQLLDEAARSQDATPSSTRLNGNARQNSAPFDDLQER